jgi:[ribosomal protein S18]-alanine N-acetyltransferase
MPIDNPRGSDQPAQMQEPNFHLRPFRSDDLPQLFELDQICFRPGIAYSRQDLQDFLLYPASETLVAEDSRGRIIGFAIMEFYRERKQVIGHVVTLDVHPLRRRQGLGRKLMFALEEIARNFGAGRLRLEVSVDDEGAQAFYFRLGFIMVGKLKKYYIHQIDALSLERSLEPVAE